jgi:hypothetical protein
MFCFDLPFASLIGLVTWPGFVFLTNSEIAERSTQEHTFWIRQEGFVRLQFFQRNSELDSVSFGEKIRRQLDHSTTKERVLLELIPVKEINDDWLPNVFAACNLSTLHIFEEEGLVEVWINRFLVLLGLVRDFVEFIVICFQDKVRIARTTTVDS